MKKQLLKLGLLLLAFNTGMAQNKQSDFSTRSAPLFNPSHAAYRTTAPQPVPTTTTSTCMSVNLPTPATWTLTNYGTGTPVGANGWVNGMNQYLDKEKAMYFDVSASANTLLTQVYVGFGLAYSATPTKTVGIKLYDGTGGTIGAQIGTTGVITMAEIMADRNAGQYSLVIFPTPLSLPASKKFFVSVDVSGLQWAAAAHDTLNVLSNVTPQTTPTPVWEKWSDNTWHQYTTSGSWNLNISLLIHPFLTQAPITTSLTASSNTICAGQSVNYNSAGSTAGTYQWDFGAASTPTATGATPSVSYPTAGTYTTILLVSDACGSLGAAQTFITVKPKPTVTATPASTAVCSGASTTLNGGGASTYTWTGGVTNGTSFTPGSSGSYTVSGTAANGCTNTAVASVTVNTLPPVVAGTSTTTVCSGSPLTLNGSGATTYTWQPGNLANGASVSPTGNTTYSVTGTDANGCSKTATVAITVNALPNVSGASTPPAVCAGHTLTLNGSGATTYTWTGGASNGVAFTPASSGTYTVTGTGANGCTKASTVAVVVNALPTVNANSSSNSVCPGGQVTLTGAGASTYTWTSSLGASVSNGVAFTPASTASYTVVGTDANGCVNSAITSVTVAPTITVTAQASAPAVCAGSNLTLTGNGASTYTWTGGVSNGVPFVPTGSGTYTVTGASGSCSGSATIAIAVNPLPTVGASATATTLCSGANTTLNGSGATTYSWTGGAVNGVAFAPTVSATYTVTGTDANTCTNTATISVVVNPLPNVMANASATAICSGSQLTLTGSGATTYTWNGGISNGTPITPTGTATYTVIGTDANTCSKAATVTVVVNALPAVGANATNTMVCTGGSVTLTGTGASTYVWTGGVTNGVAFAPSATTAYTVTGTDANGCNNTAAITVSVSACTGVAQLSAAANSIVLYPNPASGDFTIASNGLSNTAVIEVYNSIGKLVLRETLSGDKHLVSSPLASGVYFVKVIDNGTTLVTKKLIRE